MTDVKLKEVRSSIAVCSVDEGSTLEARQEANAKRRSLYARLDGYRSELEKLQVEAQAAGDDIAEIEVIPCKQVVDTGLCGDECNHGILQYSL